MTDGNLLGGGATGYLPHRTTGDPLTEAYYR